MQNASRSPCRSCAAPMVWAVTPSGKNIPINPDPVPEGNLVVEHKLRDDGRGHFWEARPPSPLLDQDKPKYVSHFATCPKASAHRKVRYGPGDCYLCRVRGPSRNKRHGLRLPPGLMVDFSCPVTHEQYRRDLDKVLALGQEDFTDGEA